MNVKYWGLGEIIMGYHFEIITGPMSCGKTEELLRRVKRCIIAQKKVKVISPEMDTRAKGDYIESRNGLWLDAITVKTAREILNKISPEDEVIAIDEIQFFDNDIVSVVKKLVEHGLDFKGEPFGSMPELLCFADKVDKLTAVCMKCGSDHATRTQRLINGFPADKSSPLIMIGGDETYEARCLDCYELPDREADNKKKSFRLLNFTK